MEERDIQNTITLRKAKWIGHILRRNCLLKHLVGGNIEGNVEDARKRGRRRKQVLDGIIEKRMYWNLKAQTVDRPVCRTRF
jgi:hypothetical protein